MAHYNLDFILSFLIYDLVINSIDPCRFDELLLIDCSEVFEAVFVFESFEEEL